MLYYIRLHVLLYYVGCVSYYIGLCELVCCNFLKEVMLSDYGHSATGPILGRYVSADT